MQFRHDEPDRITAELVEAIASSVPRLPGAKCREYVDLFDRTGQRGDGMYAARREALAVCGSCVALARCRAWIDSLPESERPRGIVAGQLVRCTDVTVAPRGRRRVG